MAEIKNVERPSTDLSSQIIKETILVDASNQPIDENVSVWVFKCRLCNAEFERLHDMAQHIVKVHDGKKSVGENGVRKCTWVYKCAICFTDLETKLQIDKHISDHGINKFYRCKICSVYFTREDLNQHKFMPCGKKLSNSSAKSQLPTEIDRKEHEIQNKEKIGGNSLKPPPGDNLEKLVVPVHEVEKLKTANSEFGKKDRKPQEKNNVKIVKPPDKLEKLSKPVDVVKSPMTESEEGNTNDSEQEKQNLFKNGKIWPCGKCEQCLRKDCGLCVPCLDKKKFGGKNTLRKKCVLKICPIQEKLKQEQQASKDAETVTKPLDKSNYHLALKQGHIKSNLVIVDKQTEPVHENNEPKNSKNQMKDTNELSVPTKNSKKVAKNQQCDEKQNDQIKETFDSFFNEFFKNSTEGTNEVIEKQVKPVHEEKPKVDSELKEQNLEKNAKIKITMHKESISCHICNSQLLSEFGLKNHLKMFHGNIKQNNPPTINQDSSLKCLKCDRMFPTEFGMKEHLKVFHKAVDNSNVLIEKQVHEGKIQTFVCDATEGAIAVHKEKFIETDLQCSVCSVEVSSIENLKNHVESVHGLKLKLRVDNNSTEQAEQVHERKEQISDETQLPTSPKTLAQLKKSNSMISKSFENSEEPNTEKNSNQTTTEELVNPVASETPTTDKNRLELIKEAKNISVLHEEKNIFIESSSPEEDAEVAKSADKIPQNLFMQQLNQIKNKLSNNVHDGKKPNERENLTLESRKKDQGGLNKGPSFLCPICCRYFWSANNLNYHISEVHEKEYFTKTSAAAVEDEKSDLPSDVSKSANSSMKSGGSPEKIEKQVQSGNKRRRVRCKICEACLGRDCKQCVYCIDMPKYGGPGRMKQTCEKRRCLDPFESPIEIQSESVEVKIKKDPSNKPLEISDAEEESKIKISNRNKEMFDKKDNFIENSEEKSLLLNKSIDKCDRILASDKNKLPNGYDIVWSFKCTGPGKGHYFQECIAEFKTKDEMTRHNRTVHEGKDTFHRKYYFDYKCAICSLQFCGTSKSSFIEHIEIFHPLIVENLSIDKSSDLTKYEVFVDDSKVLNIMSYKCKVCLKEFKRKDDMIYHNAKIHGGVQLFDQKNVYVSNVYAWYYMCAICSVEYSKIHQITDHVKSKHSVSVKTTDKLKEIDDKNSSVYEGNNSSVHEENSSSVHEGTNSTVHEENNFDHGKQNEGITTSLNQENEINNSAVDPLLIEPNEASICQALEENNSCEKVLTPYDYLWIFQCKVCSVEFKGKGDMTSHSLQTKHSCNFKCTICALEFTETNCLNEHVKIFHPAEIIKRAEKPVWIKLNGKPVKIVEHNRDIDLPWSLLAFKCKICKKDYKGASKELEFKRRDIMIQHNAMVHEGKDFYKDKYVSNYAWVFQCGFCRNEFSSQASITQHVKLLHKVEIVNQHYNRKPSPIQGRAD